MDPIPRSGQPTDPGPVPALVLSELGWWRAALTSDGPPPDPALAPRADAAGIQLLAAVLRWQPGRLSIPDDASPVAELWRRLGLDRPADADPVIRDGRLVGFQGVPQ